MKNFEFRGGAASYVGIGIVTFLMTVLTVGFAYPWAITMYNRWICRNTFVEGRQLQFKGSGFGLIGKWIVWCILIIITFGIYSFWLKPRLIKWTTENTDFAR